MANKTPKILYKYRPLFSYWEDTIDKKTGNEIKVKMDTPILNKYTLSLLTKGELYFSNPSCFNDPYDTWLPIIPDKLEEKKLYRFLHNKDFEQNSKNLRKLIREKYGGDLASFIIDLNNSYLRNPNQGSYFNTINDPLLKGYYVCCLSGCYNNILMWSHYADNHSGICIGIKRNSKTRIVVEQSEDNTLYLRPREIIYSTDYNKLPQLRKKDINKEQIYKMLLYKTKDWSYEKEYRLLLQQVSNNEGNILRLKKGSICEIFFGLKTPKEVIIKTILELQKSSYINYKDLKFYFMKDKIGFYEVEKQKLNLNDYI